ncbi:MAG: hypothetical protein P8Y69_17195 [Gammaproteobacteria bacterium]
MPHDDALPVLMHTHAPRRKQNSILEGRERKSADGTWNTTMNTPMGAQNGTLTLATDGNTLTGKLSSPQGEIDLEDGTVDGDALSWKANITSPMAMTLEFSATVSGDEISGDVKLGAFGNATFSGTRA